MTLQGRCATSGFRTKLSIVVVYVGLSCNGDPLGAYQSRRKYLCMVLLTFTPVAKTEGRKVMGPHPLDCKLELIDPSGLSCAILGIDTFGCSIVPVSLMCCDGSGSISASMLYNLIRPEGTSSTGDYES